MGFVIFESSGTFTPGNYGLSVGDTLTIVAVGGGGGGGGGGYNGSAYVASNAAAGGASSFGSYVTAAGGSAGPGGTSSTGDSRSSPGTAGGQQSTRWFDYTLPYFTGTAISTAPCLLGSAGGNGWLPGKSVVSVDLFEVAASWCYPVGKSLYYQTRTGHIVPLAYSTSSSATSPGKIGTLNESAARTDMRGGAGSGVSNKNNWGVYTENKLYVLSPGGLGYGAGGGGGIVPGYYYMGGNAGAIVTESHTLTAADLSAIAVTVGAGGKGSSSGSPSYYLAYGGGGARGCVAIFW